MARIVKRKSEAEMLEFGARILEREAVLGAKIAVAPQLYGQRQQRVALHAPLP